MVCIATPPVLLGSSVRDLCCTDLYTWSFFCSTQRNASVFHRSVIFSKRTSEENQIYSQICAVQEGNTSLLCLSAVHTATAAAAAGAHTFHLAEDSLRRAGAPFACHTYVEHSRLALWHTKKRERGRDKFTSLRIDDKHTAVYRLRCGLQCGQILISINFSFESCACHQQLFVPAGRERFVHPRCLESTVMSSSIRDEKVPYPAERQEGEGRSAYRTCTIRDAAGSGGCLVCRATQTCKNLPVANVLPRACLGAADSLKRAGRRQREKTNATISLVDSPCFRCA